jgi:hypothetical protein
MTSQPMDFDEDRDANIARRIEDQARDTAEGAAAAASDAEETLGEVIAEARGLRKKITSGAVSPTTRDARWLSCGGATGRSPLTSRPSRSRTTAP